MDIRGKTWGNGYTYCHTLLLRKPGRVAWKLFEKVLGG